RAQEGQGGPVTEIEFRSLEDIELRVGEGEDGTFEGLACRYGVVDSYGTTFHPKAFRKGLKGSYALLFMHSPYQPVGTFTAEERDDGLYIKGRYDDTAAGRDARTMARSGSAGELSVGFVRTDLPDWKKLAEMADEDRDKVLANIKGARLVEVSQITARMAAVPGSKLKTVRPALGDLCAGVDAPTIADRISQEQARRAGEGGAGPEDAGAGPPGGAAAPDDRGRCLTWHASSCPKSNGDGHGRLANRSRAGGRTATSGPAPTGPCPPAPVAADDAGKRPARGREL